MGCQLSAGTSCREQVLHFILTKKRKRKTFRKKKKKSQRFPRTEFQLFALLLSSARSAPSQDFLTQTSLKQSVDGNVVEEALDDFVILKVSFSLYCGKSLTATAGTFPVPKESLETQKL